MRTRQLICLFLQRLQNRLKISMVNVQELYPAMPSCEPCEGEPVKVTEFDRRRQESHLTTRDQGCFVRGCSLVRLWRNEPFVKVARIWTTFPGNLACWDFESVPSGSFLLLIKQVYMNVFRQVVNFYPCFVGWNWLRMVVAGLFPPKDHFSGHGGRWKTCDSRGKPSQGVLRVFGVNGIAAIVIILSAPPAHESTCCILLPTC